MQNANHNKKDVFAFLGICQKDTQTSSSMEETFQYLDLMSWYTGYVFKNPESRGEKIEKPNREIETSAGHFTHKKET